MRKYVKQYKSKTSIKGKYSTKGNIEVVNEARNNNVSRTDGRHIQLTIISL